MMGSLKFELPTKQCQNCERLFERRVDEAATNYRRRKTCSWECRNALLASLREVPGVPVPAFRRCAECGEDFARGPDEKASEFLRRATCSRVCGRRQAAKTNSKHSRELSKACRNCGDVFFRQPGISPAAFARRRVCSPACHQASFRLATTADDLERTCVVCAAVLVQRPKESTREFLERLTCGVRCGSGLRKARLPKKLVDYYGVTLAFTEVVEIEGKSKWAVERAIDRGRIPGVGWIASAPVAAPKKKYSGPLVKTCSVCGIPFPRTPKNASNFAVQTVCGATCQGVRNRLVVDPNRRCLACAKLLVCRALEPNNDFAKRLTCNRAFTLVLKKRGAATLGPKARMTSAGEARVLGSLPPASD